MHFHVRISTFHVNWELVCNLIYVRNHILVTNYMLLYPLKCLLSAGSILSTAGLNTLSPIVTSRNSQEVTITNFYFVRKRGHFLVLTF